MFCFGLFFSLQPLSAMLGISIVRQGRFLKPILLFLDLLEQVTDTASGKTFFGLNKSLFHLGLFILYMYVYTMRSEENL